VASGNSERIDYWYSKWQNFALLWRTEGYNSNWIWCVKGSVMRLTSEFVNPNVGGLDRTKWELSCEGPARTSLDAWHSVSRRYLTSNGDCVKYSRKTIQSTTLEIGAAIKEDKCYIWKNWIYLFAKQLSSSIIYDTSGRVDRVFWKKCIWKCICFQVYYFYMIIKSLL
jgi:hypothetical protein